MASKTPEKTPAQVQQDDDDEPDAWDQRINDTGCSAQNARLNDCYFEKKDWRLCKDEVEAFKACWKAKGNATRTGSRDK